MSEWINAKDELPALDVPVWCVTENNCLMIGGRVYDDDAEGWLWANTYGSFWHNGKAWDGDFQIDDDYGVKFWQYLPQPPTKEEGND